MFQFKQIYVSALVGVLIKVTLQNARCKDEETPHHFYSHLIPI